MMAHCSHCCDDTGAPWSISPEVRKIVEAIKEISAMAERLNELDHDPALRFNGIGGVGMELGHMVHREVRVGFAMQWERSLQPSNGTSIVCQLWDILSEHRRQWIYARMRENGVPWDESDAAYDAYEVLDNSTPTVAEAFSVVSVPEIEGV